jgi:hypothetical protein
MGLFDKLREPIVLKEDSDAQNQLKQLDFYSKIAPENVKEQIEQDKKLVYYGIKGEEALMFELKNSHMPMYILHDVFFEENGLKTQIDYIVITRKVTLIIECKNLYGNISIDSQGNFTRTVQFGNRYHKEGIYSPITQNQRHLDMIKEKRRNSKGTVAKALFDKYFDSNYKSVVVIANPKAVIDMKYAAEEIKSKIVKVDVLNSYIKKLNDESHNEPMSDKRMQKLADFFLENSVPNNVDYTAKYQLAANNETTVAAKEETLQNAAPESIENLPIYKTLKDYRYEQSRKEKIKPYYIFTNSQLEEIIKTNPRTLDELKLINGFGEVKCSKYGKDILSIMETSSRK